MAAPEAPLPDMTPSGDVSLLDEVKLQARVLVPVLRALREELGRETADRIVTTALRDWSRETFRRMGEATPGRPREKWRSLMTGMLPRIGNDIDVRPLRQDQAAQEFDVTGCRYADFFRALGEPELGAVLLCESDDHVAALGEGEVDFRRSQTIMKGGAYCDFRYRMK